MFTLEVYGALGTKVMFLLSYDVLPKGLNYHIQYFYANLKGVSQKWFIESKIISFGMTLNYVTKFVFPATIQKKPIKVLIFVQL